MSPREVNTRYPDGLPPWPTARSPRWPPSTASSEGVRKRGLGINVEETEAGVSGVAAAVLTPAGRPVAALTFALPDSRFSQAGHEELGRVAMRSAAGLTEALPEALV